MPVDHYHVNSKQNPNFKTAIEDYLNQRNLETQDIQGLLVNSVDFHFWTQARGGSPRNQWQLQHVPVSDGWNGTIIEALKCGGTVIDFDDEDPPLLCWYLEKDPCEDRSIRHFTIRTHRPDHQSEIDKYLNDRNLETQDIQGALSRGGDYHLWVSAVRGKLRQRTVSLYCSMSYGLFCPGTI